MIITFDTQTTDEFGNAIMIPISITNATRFLAHGGDASRLQYNRQFTSQEALERDTELGVDNV